MKKIVALFITPLLCASCTSELQTTFDSSVAAIFSSATITRAYDDQWQESDQIGIYMYDVNQELVSPYANIAYATSDAGISASFEAVSDAIYYPVDGSSVGFFAYSPFSDTVVDGLYLVDVSDQTDPAAIDLMQAITAESSYSKNNVEVSFAFNHLLSKMSLSLVAGDGMTTDELERAVVSISSQPTTASYDFATQTLEVGAVSGSEITFRELTAGELYDAILIPTQVASAQVIFEIDEVRYYWDLTDFTFSSGVEYAYSVTISKTAIEVHATQMAGWGDGDEAGEELSADLD